MEHLTDNLPSPLRTLYSWCKEAVTIGGVFGFLLLIFYLISGIRLVLSVVSYRFKGFFWGDSWRMARYPAPPSTQPMAPIPLQETTFANIPARDQIPSAQPMYPTPAVRPSVPPAGSVAAAAAFDNNRKAVSFQAGGADRYTPLDPLIKNNIQSNK